MKNETLMLLTLAWLCCRPAGAQPGYVAGIAPPSILSAPPAQPAAICDTVFSFTAVDTWPQGIVSDGTGLWNAGNAFPYLYKYDFTGQLIDSIVNPTANFGAPFFGGGLDFDGSLLLFLREESDTLYKIDPATGQVVSRFLVAPCTGNCFGVAYDGTHIWVSNYSPAYLYKLDAATGAVLSTFPLTVPSFLLPLSFVNGKLYGLTITPGQLHELDTTSGSIVASFPWCLGYPLGFCHANNAFWGVSSDIAYGGTQRIYTFDSTFVTDLHPHAGIPVDAPVASPNPFADRLTLKLPARTARLAVYDLLGQRMFQQAHPGPSVEVDASEWPAGLYLLSVHSTDGTAHYLKIMKR